ncbi:AAA family ATPase [Haemophilus sp. oral taxon 851]|uniref:AAA family ATPase n=1 Tax=Haemophilus sp. oral taxon 851 TaxID=762964 RepID=UPI000246226B|nr:AAA family ATPase [Haemophilus sp. oral taxon 851]EHO48168.1 ATPase, AAA family [Haemophilus sp. oral taxon 851 str. F0397]
MTKQNLTQQIIDYIQAGYTAFYLKTTELARVDKLTSEVAEQLNFNVIEYNLAYGRVKFENKEIIDDSLTSFEKIFNHLRHEDLENNLILIKDAKLGLENNSVALARLKYLLDQLNFYKGECAVILQSADVYLPNEIEPLVTLLELPLPDQNQIQAVLKQEKIANELTDRLTTALSGLNELDIQQLLNLLKNKYGELTVENEKVILAEIQQQKEQIIAKSGVLEMVKVNEEIEDIGGLEKLKAWLQDQSYIVKNLQAAKEFGVKAPKGTLIAGMPGCGKSLTAKAAAALFQQPLLRLDIGSLLGKYVGESETNMRKALVMAESISPCVLWVDELEKAFVGMSGNNASEVSSRLLGYFLTWLQEKTAPVFIIATANDITALPPELLRKGRFDEIFYVGFPTKKERKKIIEIHLVKAKQDASQFDIEDLAKECRDYAGADIENAIFEAVKKAFIQQGELTQELLLEAIRNTTPLRKTLKDKVGEYEKKFDELYLSPASENDGLNIAQMVKMAKDPNYMIRLKVANDENVTEEILEELSTDEVFEVREAVFKNINCSKQVLDAQLSSNLTDNKLLNAIYSNKNVSIALALDKLTEYDSTLSRVDDLFKNNDMDLLENQQAVLKHGGDYASQLLAEYKNILPEISEKLAEHNNLKVRRVLADNQNISGKTTEILSKYDDWEIKKSVAQHLNISPKASENLANDEYWYIRYLLTQNSNLAQDVAIKLAKDQTIEVRKGLAQIKHISNDVANILAIDSDDNVRMILAANISISETCKVTLAKDPNSSVKEELILKQYLLKNIEGPLSEDSNYHVRMKLAASPNVSTEIMNILSSDDDNVRAGLASNPSITEEVSKILVSDNAWRVRSNLASNSSITEEVSKILASDNDSNVRSNLASNPSITEEISKILVSDNAWHVRSNLASNLSITEEVSKILASDNDSDVRRNLASNPKISKEIMEYLMKEDYSYKTDDNSYSERIVLPVKNGLAENLNLPEEFSNILAKKYNVRISIRLAKRENISDKVAEILIGSERFLGYRDYKDTLMALVRNQGISEKTMKLLIEQGDYNVRAQLAKREDLSNEIVDILSRDSDYAVKKELTLNPIISESVVKRLQEDSYLVNNNLEKNIVYKRMQKQWID